jgi:CBS domain-containing protein
MTTPAVTISETTSLEHVAEQLTQQRIRRLPVVDSAGSLVGIVSRHDVLVWASRRVPSVTR